MAREYGKVYSRIWESADFRALSEDGRMLVMYLLTCQHGTIAGVFRVPDGYACEDLQWSSERVSEGFANLLEKGFATRCEASKWVWVTKFLEWNPPENPNQRKAAAKMAQSVPDSCAWKREFMRVCGSLLGLQCPVDNQPLPNPSPTVPQPVTVAVAGTVAVPPPPEPEGSFGGVGAAANGSDEGPAAGAAASTRGHRLSKDWKLPKAWGDWALTEFPQWDAAKVRREGESFLDHWVAKSGKDATKCDWLATWRNWCRSSIAHRDDPKGAAPAGSATPTQAEANAFLAAQAAIPKPDPELARQARERFSRPTPTEPTALEGEAA